MPVLTNISARDLGNEVNLSTLGARLAASCRDSGLDDAAARDRAAAIDAFVLGVSTGRRVLGAEPGDPTALETWLATTIRRPADG